MYEVAAQCAADDACPVGALHRPPRMQTFRLCGRGMDSLCSHRRHKCQDPETAALAILPGQHREASARNQCGLRQHAKLKSQVQALDGTSVMPMARGAVTSWLSRSSAGTRVRRQPLGTTACGPRARPLEEHRRDVFEEAERRDWPLNHRRNARN